MKKGKFVQHLFISLGKLELEMNLQIFLHAQGPMPKISTRNFFLEHLMYQSIPSLTIPLGQPTVICTFSLPEESGLHLTFFAVGVGVLN